MEEWAAGGGLRVSVHSLLPECDGDHPVFCPCHRTFPIYCSPHKGGLSPSRALSPSPLSLKLLVPGSFTMAIKAQFRQHCSVSGRLQRHWKFCVPMNSSCKNSLTSKTSSSVVPASYPTSFSLPPPPQEARRILLVSSLPACCSSSPSAPAFLSPQSPWRETLRGFGKF